MNIDHESGTVAKFYMLLTITGCYVYIFLDKANNIQRGQSDLLKDTKLVYLICAFAFNLRFKYESDCKYIFSHMFLLFGI